MIRRIVAPLAVALIVVACSARAGTDTQDGRHYRMSLDEAGDTAWYHLANESVIGMVPAPADTMTVRSSEDYVLELARISPDTVIGFFDHIRIMVTRGERVIPVPMEPLYRREFVLTDSAGRLAVRALPAVHQMEPSVRESARLLDEMFFTVPAAPLQNGMVWVDTVRARHELSGARYSRNYVTRYEVAGDTTLHGVTAKLIRYESALDNEAAQLNNDSARTVLVGTETGSIVYSPARRLILSRQRRGRLDGEMVMPAGDGFQHMPHFYEFSVAIELLPPRAPGAAADTADAPPARRED